MRQERGELESSNGAACARQVRCVILCPAQVALPQVLLAGLSKRRAEVLVLTDAPSVLRELALGLTRAVVLVEPGRLVWRDELVDAVRTYYPRVALWRYEPARGGSLLPVNGKNHVAEASVARSPMAALYEHAGSREVKRSSASTSASGNGGRPAGRPGRFRSLVTSVEPPCGDAKPEPLLSEEELTLLLRPYDNDSGEQPR